MKVIELDMSKTQKQKNKSPEYNELSKQYPTSLINVKYFTYFISTYSLTAQVILHYGGLYLRVEAQGVSE